VLATLLLFGCGDPLDRVFASHEAQLGECLGLRAQAEEKAAAATRLSANTLGGGASRLEAQSERHIADTLHKTHAACLARLFEAARASAHAEGISDEELERRWPAWYDAQASSRRGRSGS
jgi:hypothetical protein